MTKKIMTNDDICFRYKSWTFNSNLSLSNLKPTQEA